jgi:hypothetical protein
MPVRIVMAVRFFRISFLVAPKGTKSYLGPLRSEPASRRLILAAKGPVRVRESGFDEPSLGAGDLSDGLANTAGMLERNADDRPPAPRETPCGVCANGSQPDHGICIYLAWPHLLFHSYWIDTRLLVRPVSETIDTGLSCQLPNWLDE